MLVLVTGPRLTVGPSVGRWDQQVTLARMSGRPLVQAQPRYARERDTDRHAGSGRRPNAGQNALTRSRGCARWSLAAAAASAYTRSQTIHWLGPERSSAEGSDQLNE